MQKHLIYNLFFTSPHNNEPDALHNLQTFPWNGKIICAMSRIINVICKLVMIAFKTRFTPGASALSLMHNNSYFPRYSC